MGNGEWGIGNWELGINIYRLFFAPLDGNGYNLGNPPNALLAFFSVDHYTTLQVNELHIEVHILIF
jgi:hypothetical protein